ncbi:thermonuclease family protein [Sansalvadorimonas verongulae]|uniref:thermonuclease family protein n=1 Tax=Sansalvadorimonas verongulae TaxID=2172824 RepID=UPI0012BC5719|nr:thermonuclease family protein [Sansalvadorimonas verongulae]MTI11958.1 thermonuclease family protein [Sansalvadorimonas verongulae]
MKESVLFIVITLFSLTGTASDKDYGTAIVEELISVYDADTFRVHISGWPDIVGNNIPIRADGFDAPEIRGKCPQEKVGAQRAKSLTVNALENAQTIELRNMRRGKYFRIIADVYVDDRSLKDMHLSAGTAVPYSGGTRISWCSE